VLAAQKAAARALVVFSDGAFSVIFLKRHCRNCSTNIAHATCLSTTKILKMIAVAHASHNSEPDSEHHHCLHCGEEGTACKGLQGLTKIPRPYYEPSPRQEQVRIRKWAQGYGAERWHSSSAAASSAKYGQGPTLGLNAQGQSIQPQRSALHGQQLGELVDEALVGTIAPDVPQHLAPQQLPFVYAQHRRLPAAGLPASAAAAIAWRAAGSVASRAGRLLSSAGGGGRATCRSVWKCCGGGAR